jgi:hypothetical protein
MNQPIPLAHTKEIIHRNINFFSHAPIYSPSGFRVGAIAVMDYKPRSLTGEQQDALWRLSGQLKNLLDLKLQLSELAKTNMEKNTAIGMISHDVRQPLSNIMLSCEMVIDSKQVVYWR